LVTGLARLGAPRSRSAQGRVHGMTTRWPSWEGLWHGRPPVAPSLSFHAPGLHSTRPLILRRSLILSVFRQARGAPQSPRVSGARRHIPHAKGACLSRGRWARGWHRICAQPSPGHSAAARVALASRLIEEACDEPSTNTQAEPSRARGVAGMVSWGLWTSVGLEIGQAPGPPPRGPPLASLRPACHQAADGRGTRLCRAHAGCGPG
jgi:hypothetical protein